MFGVIGVANVFDDVGVYSSLQQVIPPRLMGRALGVRRGLLLLSMGLGSAVTPWLIDAWGARGTLIATGWLLVALAAAFLPRLTAIDGKISAPGAGQQRPDQGPEVLHHGGDGHSTRRVRLACAPARAERQPGADGRFPQATNWRPRPR